MGKIKTLRELDFFLHEELFGTNRYQFTSKVAENRGEDVSDLTSRKVSVPYYTTDLNQAIKILEFCNHTKWAQDTWMVTLHCNSTSRIWYVDLNYEGDISHLLHHAIRDDEEWAIREPTLLASHQDPAVAICLAAQSLIEGTYGIDHKPKTSL